MNVQHSLDAGAGAARSGMHAAAGRSGWPLMLRRCQGVVRGNKQPAQAQAVRGMSAVAIRSWLGFGLGLGSGLGLG